MDKTELERRLKSRSYIYVLNLRIGDEPHVKWLPEFLGPIRFDLTGYQIERGTFLENRKMIRRLVQAWIDDRELTLAEEYIYLSRALSHYGNVKQHITLRNTPPVRPSEFGTGMGYDVAGRILCDAEDTSFLNPCICE